VHFSGNLDPLPPHRTFLVDDIAPYEEEFVAVDQVGESRLAETEEGIALDRPLFKPKPA
jgi:hypothetical protein